MIRAVLQNGKIQPLEPIPEAWTDGTELSVGEMEVIEVKDLDRWRRELEDLVAANDPCDFTEVQQMLAERDRIDKELMRREMELHP